MNLFRKIRQSLLKEGNLRKYLSYAVGEILLIMIGVLLAFQISNWNTKRTNQKAEIFSYQNIKRQLHEDMGIISRNVNYNNRYLRQFELADEIIEANDRSQLDTLASISLNLVRYSDFHRAGNIYETIVNSGQIKLLHNQEIVERLQRLEENYVYINKMEDIHLEVIKQIIIPDLLETIEFSSHKAEKPDELYSFEFKNRFTFLIDIMNEKNDVYNQAIHEINGIIELIDGELGTH